MSGPGSLGTLANTRVVSAPPGVLWTREDSKIISALRAPRRLGKVCCEACPIRLAASGVGFSGGCKAGFTLKE